MLRGGLATAESVPTALLSTARGSELKPPLFDVPLVFTDMWIRAKSGRGEPGHPPSPTGLNSNNRPHGHR